MIFGTSCTIWVTSEATDSNKMIQKVIIGGLCGITNCAIAKAKLQFFPTVWDAQTPYLSTTEHVVRFEYRKFWTYANLEKTQLLIENPTPLY